MIPGATTSLRWLYDSIVPNIARSTDVSPVWSFGYGDYGTSSALRPIPWWKDSYIVGICTTALRTFSQFRHTRASEFPQHFVHKPSNRVEVLVRLISKSENRKSQTFEICKSNEVNHRLSTGQQTLDHVSHPYKTERKSCLT